MGKLEGPSVFFFLMDVVDTTFGYPRFHGDVLSDSHDADGVAERSPWTSFMEVVHAIEDKLGSASTAAELPLIR